MWGRFMHVMTRYMGTTLYVHFDNFYGIFVVKHAIFILKMCQYSCNLYVFLRNTRILIHNKQVKTSLGTMWGRFIHWYDQVLVEYVCRYEK
jgi:hypothetical protein